MKFIFKHRVEIDGEFTGAIYKTENDLWFYRKAENGKVSHSSPWKEGKDSPFYYSLEDLMESL